MRRSRFQDAWKSQHVVRMSMADKHQSQLRHLQPQELTRASHTLCHLHLALCLAVWLQSIAMHSTVQLLTLQQFLWKTGLSQRGIVASSASPSLHGNRPEKAWLHLSLGSECAIQPCHLAVHAFAGFNEDALAISQAEVHATGPPILGRLSRPRAQKRQLCRLQPTHSLWVHLTAQPKPCHWKGGNHPSNGYRQADYQHQVFNLAGGVGVMVFLSRL